MSTAVLDKPKPDIANEIWTTEEVAAYLGISTDLVRSEAKKGKIPATQIGSIWRFSSAKIRALC